MVYRFIVYQYQQIRKEEGLERLSVLTVVKKFQTLLITKETGRL